MFWICKECGWENEYSEESQLSPCGCCGAPAPAKLEPAGANFYQKAYLLLKNVEYGDSDAKTEAIDRAIHYLKEQGIREEEARSAVSTQVQMLGWEETVAPKPRKGMFGITHSDGAKSLWPDNPKPKRETAPEKKKTPGKILSHWKKMPVLNRVTFLLGLFSVAVLVTGYFQLRSLFFWTDSDRGYAGMYSIWVILMLSNLVHLWKDGFDFPGILGILSGKNGVLSFISSMIFIGFGLACYFSAPLFMIITREWIDWRIIFRLNPWTKLIPFGAAASEVFAFIWYGKRMSVYGKIDKKRKEETRRAKTGKG